MATIEERSAELRVLVKEFNENIGAYKQLDGSTFIQNHAFHLEVRYFAQAFVDAWTYIDEGDTDSDHLQLAIEDARRANMHGRHDITDGHIRFYCAELVDVITRFGVNRLREIEGMGEALELQGKLTAFVANSRDVRRERKDIYESIRAEDIPNLKATIDVIHRTEGLLVRFDKRLLYERIFAYAFGVGGFVLAIIEFLR